jgi:hypothetical protein
VKQEIPIITQKILLIRLLSWEKNSIREKYNIIYLGTLINPLRLSLKYSLRKKVMKTIIKNRKRSTFIGVDGGAIFLTMILFTIKIKIINPTLISTTALENVTPNNKSQRKSSVK